MRNSRRTLLQSAGQTAVAAVAAPLGLASEAPKLGIARRVTIQKPTRGIANHDDSVRRGIQFVMELTKPGGPTLVVDRPERITR